VTPRRTAAAALTIASLLSLAGCGSDGGSTPRDESSPTSHVPVTTSADTEPDVTAATADVAGAVFGVSFAASSQVVAFDSMAQMWRLRLLPVGHGCDDAFAQVSPAVGVDFIQPADGDVSLPKVGTITGNDGLGVTFDGGRESGPFTTTIGVTLRLDGLGDEAGDHWTGHLTVASDPSNEGNEYDGDLDAVVCEVAA